MSNQRLNPTLLRVTILAGQGSHHLVARVILIRSALKMKFVATFLIVSLSMSAATWDRLPDIIFFESHLESVESNLGKFQPWTADKPLPLNFRDAGLDSPVELVDSDTYLDGGSHIYLFRGANGKFLAVCTDSGVYGTRDGKVVSVETPKLYLGVLHFSEKGRVPIPLNSPCEQFLLDAINAEADRLEKTPGPWKRLPNHSKDPSPKPGASPAGQEPRHG